MSLLTREELLRRFGKVDDPEIEARRQQILRFLLDTSPEVRQQLIDEGQLVEARDALRRVLALRHLPPSPDQDARIAACTDLPTLKRWLDRAVIAASADDALA